MSKVLKEDRARVLLIGVDPDVTRVLQVYLNAHRFSTQVLNQSEEALIACRQSSPDAVILAPNLPNIDGCHLCRQIRANEQAGRSFILVLLSTDDRDVKLAALEAGADDVMVRPIDIEEVLLKLKGALGR